MLDVNKATTSPNDPEGHMFGLEHWSPLVAKHKAEAEGIDLSEEHWAIINYLRERYREHGDAKSAREILSELEEKFTDDTRHEGHWQKDRDHGQGGGRRRERDLAGAIECSLNPILSHFLVTHDVLQHHDRIVDHNADGQA